MAYAELRGTQAADISLWIVRVCCTTVSSDGSNIASDCTSNKATLDEHHQIRADPWQENFSFDGRASIQITA
jgi:hypothetical protein